MVADAVGRGRGRLARVDAAGRGGQDLGQGDLDALDIFGLQGPQVGADEAAVEGGADVVRVALDHEAEVEEAVEVEVEVADLAAEHDTGDDGRTRAAEAAAQGDGVLDVYVRLDGEHALAVAAQDVQRHAGDEVDGRVEADVSGALALALVGDAAVERLRGRGLGPVDGDVQLEVDGQGEADDIEAGADVGRRRRRLDDEGLHGLQVGFVRSWRLASREVYLMCAFASAELGV
jgi:hypothetical protein